MKTMTKTTNTSNRSNKTLVIALLALGATLGAGACDRAHLTASYGRANREAFNRQIANPTAATKAAPAAGRAIQGLDSQEAAIIAKTYREGLAPKQDDGSGRNQLLYVAPRGAQTDHGDMPPPSVPQQH